MNPMMTFGKCGIFLFYIFRIGVSLSAQSEFYQANSLFHTIGSAQDLLPLEGFAVEMKPSQVYGNLLYEERFHYHNSILQEHWYFFYLSDGRLHAKKKLDKVDAIVYEEVFIYNRMKELHMIIMKRTQYLFRDRYTLWKQEDSLQKIRMQGTDVLRIKERTPFTKDPLLQEQIEEIWQDGVLKEIKFYRFGEIQRSKKIESGMRFIETIYHRGQAVFRRTIDNDAVVNEEYIDEE